MLFLKKILLIVMVWPWNEAGAVESSSVSRPLAGDKETAKTVESSHSETPGPFEIRYIKNELSSSKRGLAVIFCGNGNKLQVDSYSGGEVDAAGTDTGPKTQKLLLMSGHSCASYVKSAFPDLPQTDFDRKDRELMKTVKETFYESSEKMGTKSLQHGHETDTVYVLLHGLFGEGEESFRVARQKFLEGSNVLIGTLPGHEKEALVDSENNAGIWMEYAEHLGRVARHYGRKVVFIGRSTGANLAVRAAEKGYADKVVLIQPLFEMSPYMKTAMTVGKWLPDGIKNFSKLNCAAANALGRNGIHVEAILNAAEQAAAVAKVKYYKIKTSVPVDIYIADKDPVVSAKATEKWAQEFAPHARLIHHPQPRNHQYDPF